MLGMAVISRFNQVQAIPAQVMATIPWSPVPEREWDIGDQGLDSPVSVLVCFGLVEVPREGFEPPTLCLEDRCSIH